MAFLDVIVSTKGSVQGRGGFDWTKASNRWMQATGPAVRDAIKAKAPVSKTPMVAAFRGAGPGRLRDSIRFQSSTSTGVARSEFIAQVPYAGYVVNGTRPHRIVPRQAKMLHFLTAADGVPVFAHGVNHPGTKANPFAQRSVEAMVPMVRTVFTEIMQAAMGGTP